MVKHGAGGDPAPRGDLGRSWGSEVLSATAGIVSGESMLLRSVSALCSSRDPRIYASQRPSSRIGNPRRLGKFALLLREGRAHGIHSRCCRYTHESATSHPNAKDVTARGLGSPGSPQPLGEAVDISTTEQVNIRSKAERPRCQFRSDHSVTK